MRGKQYSEIEKDFYKNLLSKQDKTELDKNEQYKNVTQYI